MNKTYNPQENEDQIYQKWEKSGFFNPDKLPLDSEAPNYTIILPPPNITAKLHLGHAATIAIEDLFIRFHRLNGYRTLWLPGTDHAAIATQNVVEKKILKEENKTRHDLGRELFLEKTWSFVKETQSTILDQIKKMGASIDWSRQAFTLDEDRQKAVRKIFVDMYQEGVIYRGERVINWCPRCQSTLADDEIEYQEQEAMLYTFKYQADFPIAISTTRPETKLADTALAVNPKDKRYQKYIGQTYQVNFCGQDLEIKIIADPNVEMDFGTGALGITPAHSLIDSQIAQKNNLKTIKLITEDGKIRPGFKDFSGKTSLEARDLVVKRLKENNLLLKEEKINNNLSLCYRCQSSIEPLPSKQWFVAVDKKIPRLGDKSLKDLALQAVESGEIEIIPERFNKKYLNWMNNLHDWCISRQIWFGHQIPVWYKDEEIYVGMEDPQDPDWTQDPDTLDTWFSSGMWTFSTLGWPDNFKNNTKTGDLKKFHPTQMLETGYEIITLWVSRMIMMSFFALEEKPFDKVYLHGMVLDETGKKMSKSKGNGIDPLDVIKEFGNDALRLSLLLGNSPGNDFKIGLEKITNSRNFVNKLWNISRYIITNSPELSDQYDPDNLSLSDKWILNKFKDLIHQASLDIKEYRFGIAGEKMRDFTWNDLADWYLEAKKFEKSDNNSKILIFILKNLLKLWHPFIPFITETIWQELQNQELLMVSSWPTELNLNFSKEEEEFELIKKIIIAIRNARFTNQLETNQKIKAQIIIQKDKELIQSQIPLITNLKTGISEINFIEDKERPEADKNILITVDDIEIYLLDVINPEKEAERRQKERAKIEKMISFLENKLANQDFATKAPTTLVEKERARLQDYKSSLEKLI
ncbi:MAG TPA: valine--tRNA ligase [Patescibacteria group bacterium]|nr:valine--tRNA ligase [Patescibacteria group bacterium]